MSAAPSTWPPPWPWHPSPSAWKRLALGEPSRAEAPRLAAHLGHCGRCQHHYARLLLGVRLLESGDASRPAQGELALLRLAGPEKILAAVADRAPAWRPRPLHLLAACAALAVTCALLVLPGQRGSPREAQPTPAVAPERLTARGAELPRGVLRVFCWRPTDAPEGRTEELAEGGSCGEEGTLVFAAATRLPEAFVVLKLEGHSPASWGPFPIQARAGSEEVLTEPTLSLKGLTGPLHIVAAFAAHPDEALRCVEAPQVEARALIRRTVRVVPAPPAP